MDSSHTPRTTIQFYEKIIDVIHRFSLSLSLSVRHQCIHIHARAHTHTRARARARAPLKLTQSGVWDGLPCLRHSHSHTKPLLTTKITVDQLLRACSSRGSEQAERHTAGLQLGRAEMLRGSSNSLSKDRPEHHRSDHLQEGWERTQLTFRHPWLGMICVQPDWFWYCLGGS